MRLSLLALLAAAAAAGLAHGLGLIDWTLSSAILNVAAVTGFVAMLLAFRGDLGLGRGANTTVLVVAVAWLPSMAVDVLQAAGFDVPRRLIAPSLWLPLAAIAGSFIFWFVRARLAWLRPRRTDPAR